MPLIFKQNINSDTQVGVWKITETETELGEGLILSKKDQDTILSLTLSKRRLERIVCRKILALLLQQNEIIITYGEHGEPLMNNLHLSFSHSGEMVAVAISGKNPIGIDIERVQDRIVALQSKFMSENELSVDEIHNKEAITRIWTAKEAVYKLFSSLPLDFKEQIFVKSDSAKIFLSDEICSVKLRSWKIEEGQYMLSLSYPEC